MKNPGYETQRAVQDSSGSKTSVNKKTSSGGTTPTRGPAEEPRRSGSVSASTISHQVKSLLDDQVGNGAEIVARFAKATKKAADELDSGSPQTARFVRGVAVQLDHYAEALGDQSAEELVQTASDYTRRQPAFVFGVAAIIGFLAVRTFKTASARPLRSAETQQPIAARRGQFNGN